jgi:ligand-binding sensor domain-containing protein
MHYVAMAGTSYEVLDPSVSPPIAPLTTAALIAIIASIVVVTCVGLLIIQVWQSKILLRKQKTSQVAVSAIYYDQDGKLLVKDDGTVPMKEIQTDTEKVWFCANFDGLISDSLLTT